MGITVNGKSEAIRDKITIEDYLKGKNLDPQHVVVEINLEIVKKDQYAFTVINSGDRLEILHFVGGG